ncbi:helix-turn-helix transcriptional regulator [Actinocatenispora rupis]|nr:AraC family transcriptional regulator [Actinocatenispora rupis]
MRYHSWTTTDTGAWRDLSDSILPMDHRFRTPGTWRADLTAQETPTYRLLRWVQHGDRTAVRTPRHIRRVPGDEHYWLVIPQRGVYTVRHGDDETRTPPGYASVMGMDEACQLVIPDSEAHAIQVPRGELDRNLRPRRPLRLVVDMETGFGRVLDSLVRSVHAERDALSGHEFLALCDRITELFSLMATRDPRPSSGHLGEVAEVVRRYVREHLGAGKLPLTTVARELGWSPRHLRTALQQAGTTYRDLRHEETLRAARDMLQDPACADLGVADIAARSGLTATWFASAFKERYGESPREFRRRRFATRPAR